MNHSSNFGAYIKGLRIQKHLTLREFSAVIGLNVVDQSRIERGVSVAPETGILERYREILEIAADLPEWQQALELAELSRQEVPSRALSDAELVRKLPFILKVPEINAGDRTLDDLAETIRQS